MTDPAPMPLIEKILVTAWLSLALVLPTFTHADTPYLIGLAALVGAIYVTARRGDLAVQFDLAAKLFAASIVLLAVLIAITARKPGDVVLALNFTMLLLYTPMATVLARAASPSNVRTVAVLAGIGAVLVLLNVLGDVYLRNLDRPTAPNKLARFAITLGFASLMGVMVTTSWRRWLFAGAPILAGAAMLLTGSRGALLAVPPLLLLAALVLTPRRRRLVAVLVALGILAAGAIVLAQVPGLRSSSLFAIVERLVNGEAVVDTTTEIRLDLYRAGWAAFQEAPIFGHGWAHLMSASRAHMPADANPLASHLPQLHNDILNFAVAGGIVGVAIYFLIVATPVIAAWRSPRDSQYGPRLFGTTVLAVSFLCFGLTDLTIGFEFGTAIFITVSAILLAYCRDAPPALPDRPTIRA